MRRTDLTACSMAPSARTLCGLLGAATVHTVFDRAAYLKTERGALLVLADEMLPDGAGTIRVVGHQLWPSITPAGTLARLNPSLIQFVDVRLDLRGAAVWRTPRIPRPASHLAVRRALAHAAAAARTRGASGLAALAGTGLDGTADGLTATALVRHAEPLVRGLARALADRDLAAVRDAAGRLAGLGPGATPSGDDLLAGVMVGWRYAGAGGAVPLAIWRAAVTRTSWASAQFLEYAVNGEASAPLLAAASAMVRGGRPAALDSLLKALLATGETSGADTLAGLVVGLTAGLRLGTA